MSISGDTGGVAEPKSKPIRLKNSKNFFIFILCGLESTLPKYSKILKIGVCGASLPLYGAWGLASDIIDYAVDALDLIDDAIANSL